METSDQSAESQAEVELEGGCQKDHVEERKAICVGIPSFWKCWEPSHYSRAKAFGSSRQGGPLLRATQIYPKGFGRKIASLHRAYMAVSSLIFNIYYIYTCFLISQWALEAKASFDNEVAVKAIEACGVGIPMIMYNIYIPCKSVSNLLTD